MQQGKIKAFCFGTITNKKKLYLFYLFSSILTGVFCIISFVLLGSFYKAKDNTIFINIIVWLLTILVTYLLLFLLYYLIVKFIKKAKHGIGPFINGFAIASGYLTILFMCLANSYKVNDYLYVEVAALMSSIFGIAQFFIGFLNAKKVKKTFNERK